MSITQPNIWNVVTLHPQNPQGQGDEFNFTIGPDTRTLPDNQAGFRTYSTTYTEAPAPSFFSTATELRLPVMEEQMDIDTYQPYMHDIRPYEKGLYAPPGAPPLFFWPTEEHGLPLAGPFDDQAIHLTDTRGQIVDSWPFIPPGINPVSNVGGRRVSGADMAMGAHRPEGRPRNRGHGEG